MRLDNRNKKIAHEPEVEAIVNEDIPVEVKEADTAPDDPKEDMADDIIEDKAPDAIDDSGDSASQLEPQVQPKPQPETDYKEKYINSSKEAIVLYSKNKKLNDTIDEAASISDPTDDELRAYAKTQGAEYDDLEEFSKNILKRTYINEKRFEKIHEVAQESKRMDEWVGKVDKFVDSEEVQTRYPSLSDYGDEFRAYCLSKPQRRFLDLDELVAAFLFHAEKATPKKNKGSLLLSGGNSNAAPEKPKGISEEDLMALRKSGEKGQKEYRRLIKEGKVKLNV